MRRALLSRPMALASQNRQKHDSLIPQGAGGRSSWRLDFLEFDSYLVLFFLTRPFLVVKLLQYLAQLEISDTL